MTFPKELKRGKQKNNPVSYGNVNKFVNDTTDCLYQTSSMIIDSDVSLQSQKACCLWQWILSRRFLPNYTSEGHPSLSQDELCSLLVCSVLPRQP